MYEDPCQALPLPAVASVRRHGRPGGAGPSLGGGASGPRGRSRVEAAVGSGGQISVRAYRNVKCRLGRSKGRIRAEYKPVHTPVTDVWTVEKDAQEFERNHVGCPRLKAAGRGGPVFGQVPNSRQRVLVTAGSLRRNLSGEVRKFRTMPKNEVGCAKAAGQAGCPGGQDLA